MLREAPSQRTLPLRELRSGSLYDLMRGRHQPGGSGRGPPPEAKALSSRHAHDAAPSGRIVGTATIYRSHLFRGQSFRTITRNCCFVFVVDWMARARRQTCGRRRGNRNNQGVLSAMLSTGPSARVPACGTDARAPPASRTTKVFDAHHCRAVMSAQGPPRLARTRHDGLHS